MDHNRLNPWFRWLTVGLCSTFAIFWCCAGIASYPILVIADSDLGREGYALTGTAMALGGIGVAIAVLASGAIPAVRLRLILSVSLLALVVAYSFPHEETRAHSRTLGAGLVIAFLSLDWTLSRRMKNPSLAFCVAVLVGSALTFFTLVADRECRIWLDLEPVSRVACRPDPSKIRTIFEDGMHELVSAYAEAPQTGLRAIGSDTGRLRVEGLNHEPAFLRDAISPDRRIAHLAFSPDGCTLAVADNDHRKGASEITIWDVVPGLEIDAKKNPATVKLTMTESPFGAGAVAKGIIELKGDQLRICYDAADGAAPKTFATKEGEKTHLFVLKRAK